MPRLQYLVRFKDEAGALGLIRLKTIDDAAEVLGLYAGSAHYRDFVPVCGPVSYQADQRSRVKGRG